MPHSFADYLRDLQVRNFRTVREFAEVLDVDPTHLSRAMGTNSRPFDINGLFKLAEVTGENPSDVLRAAGKGDLADRIESLYGKPQPVRSRRLRDIVKLVEEIEASGLDDEGLDLALTHLRRSAQIVRQRRAVRQQRRRA
jgi:hypothetical protein